MAAPKGNRFWEARSSHGRNPKFESPEALWAACCEYFEWVEANPLWEMKAFSYQGEVIQEPIAKMRAMTIIQTVCLLVAVISWRSGTVGVTSSERNLAITGANNADSATSAHERCRKRLPKRRLYRLSASEYVGYTQRNPEQQRISSLIPGHCQTF